MTVTIVHDVLYFDSRAVGFITQTSDMNIRITWDNGQTWSYSIPSHVDGKPNPELAALYEQLFESVHISDVRVGDVIDHGGAIRSVCKKDLREDTVFDDSYKLGYKPVRRVIVPRYFKGEVQ